MTLPEKQVIRTVEEMVRLRENNFVGSFINDASRVKGVVVSSTKDLPGGNRRNVYTHDLQPILTTLQIVGVLCYRITPSGEVHKVPLLSCFMLYALLIHVIMMATGILILLEKIPNVAKPGVPFLDRVISVGFVLLYSVSCITPVTSWLEHKRLTQFFTQWETFQTRYTKATGKQLRLGLRRKCLISLATVLISSGILTVNAFFLGKAALKSVWQAIPFIYSLLLGFLMPCVWYLTCKALTRAAKLLTSHLDQCYRQHSKLTELRHLWRLLSSLTREVGSAMGLTCGALTLIHLSMQTLTLYATIYSILDYHLVAQLPIFVTAASIFAGLLYIQCDAAGKATDQVGEQFQQHLEEFSLAHSGVSTHLDEEISLFLEALKISPPVMTYSSYVDVNQHLMVSLMSSIVTYIIVLLQFHIGLQHTTKAS